MRRIRLGLWGLLLGLTLLWVLANPNLSDAPSFIAVRNDLVQYTGVIGIGVMSVAMLLAIRLRWLEPYLGGLDKSYRLHKWLGIAGLVAAIAHWIAANGPKWMVGLGLIERPERGPRPEGEALGAIQQFLGEQRGAAEFIGEWAFYAAVLLIALALIKRFPYRLFVKTHKLLAIVYVALVLHSVVLMDVEAWIQPIGLMTGILMAAGVISALLVLLDQIGKGQEVQGTIESLLYVPEMRVLETVIRLDDGWQGHQGGQFAFVTFDRKEGQHPFTIASAWDPAERRIMFITKALGDYTDFLPDRLNAGDQVKVEGPYGRFTFDDGNRRQIWIGGGIGITPFIARMKQLAQAPDDQAIDLFHTVADDLDPVVKNKLNADVAASKVNLHLMIDSKDGFLTADRLRDMVPDWKDASVWFCGPAGFGHALRKDLTSSGLAAKDFHQELFNMR